MTIDHEIHVHIGRGQCHGDRTGVTVAIQIVPHRERTRRRERCPCRWIEIYEQVGVEAGFQSDPPLGHTYGLKGKTPVVVTSGQRQSLNVISAVNARGEFWAATCSWRIAKFAFKSLEVLSLERTTRKVLP